MTESAAYQQCVLPGCAATIDVRDVQFACPHCGGLLDVCYDWSRLPGPSTLAEFDARIGATGTSLDARLNRSGVWRFRELLPFAACDELVTLGEGRTLLQPADALATVLGMRSGRLYLQYEGFNPSGSFKDNGMAAAFTMARLLGRTRVACASTGNTSASIALFARNTTTRSGAPMQAIVFVGDDKIALGKLAQALDYGATTLQVRGDFDECMRLVRKSAERLDLYVMNSVNPFRLEGQKSIMYRVLEGLNWEVPDWIVVPGGNLGNSSAFGKAFHELMELGLIDRMPRLAIINATGANSLDELVNRRGVRFNAGGFDASAVAGYFDEMNSSGRAAKTVASAIEIGRPVNLVKALRSLEWMNGVVRSVPDEEILDGKALVGRFGFGCEPASGASIAGLRLLLQQQVIAPSDRVVCILTGHALKDPQVTIDYHRAPADAGRGHALANAPISVGPTLDEISSALHSGS